MEVDEIMERIGGRGVLGAEPNSAMDLIRVFSRGLPSLVLEHLLETSDLSRSEACNLIGSRRSLMHRLQERKGLRAGHVKSDRQWALPQI